VGSNTAHHACDLGTVSGVTEGVNQTGDGSHSYELGTKCEGTHASRGSEGRPVQRAGNATARGPTAWRAHHLAHGAPDPKNTILIVGFQAENTLGRRIVDRQRTLKIYGEDVPLRAQVEVLNGYSAHADRSELRRWIHAVRGESPRALSVHLVHGEPDAQDTFAGVLRGDGFVVTTPERGTTLSL